MALPINDAAAIRQYTATAGQTVFDVPFEFFEDADLAVYQNASRLTLTTGYTVTGAGVEGGGSITLTSGATEGDTLTVMRDVAVKRVTDFPVSGPFQIAALNEELSRLTAMVQQVETKLETRTLRLPDYDRPAMLSALPVQATRANKYLGFNSSGNPTILDGAVVEGGNSAASLDIVSILDFIPEAEHAAIRLRTSTTDVAAYLQAAVDEIEARGGGVLEIPAGTFIVESPITLCRNITIVGAGRNSTILKSSFAGTTVATGSLFIKAETINASTAVNVFIRDLQIWNTNTANLGAAFYDTCGTYIELYNVHFRGWKYGVILDQSELAEIDLCHFSPQYNGGACLWLVNGPDLNPSILGGFTNRISITRNQFNPGASAAWAVIDDGGYLHSYRDNNINGGGFRLAGVFGLCLDASEWESVVGKPILTFSSTTLSGFGAGPCHGSMKDNFFAAIIGNPAIQINSAAALGFITNQFSVPDHASVTAAVQGVVNVADLFARGNTNSYIGTPMFDAKATFHDDAKAISQGSSAATAVTMAASDFGKVHYAIGDDATNAEITYTVPADADLDALAGTRVEVMASEEGVVKIVGAPGVTISGPGKALGPHYLRGKHARCILEKAAADFWLISGDGLAPAVVEEAATTITALQTHVNATVKTTAATAVTYTVAPQAATFRAAPETKIKLRQMGAGQVTVAPGAGVTLRSEGGKLKTTAQYAEIELTHLGSDEWLVTGNRAV